MKMISSTLLLIVLVFSVNANANIMSVTNDDFGVVDNSFDFRDFDFSSFADTQAVVNAVISVTFSKCSASTDANGCSGDGGSPFNNEIGLALIAPTGEFVSLVENNSDNELFETGNFETFVQGTGNFNLITIVFDDLGASLGSTPSSGTFAPEGSLSDFIGLNANGTWRLFFEDDVGADALVFHTATLTLTTRDVPVPALLPVFATLLLGLGLMRRRTRQF